MGFSSHNMISVLIIFADHARFLLINPRCDVGDVQSSIRWLSWNILHQQPSRNNLFLLEPFDRSIDRSKGTITAAKRNDHDDNLNGNDGDGNDSINSRQSQQESREAAWRELVPLVDSTVSSKWESSMDTAESTAQSLRHLVETSLKVTKISNGLNAFLHLV
jgi:hypothetical protein